MNKENLDSLVETISQLNAMQDADNDQRAVELYRAIFRNDVDINKLDFNYADHILGYVEFGVEKAEVDYRNYLKYLKMISPEAYLSHLDMFNKAIRSRDDENFEEDKELDETVVVRKFRTTTQHGAIEGKTVLP